MGEAVLVFNTGVGQVCHTHKKKFVAKTAFCCIFRRKTHLQQGWLPRPVEKNRLACPVKSKPCPAVAEIDKTHRAQWLKNGWKKNNGREVYWGLKALFGSLASLEFIPLPRCCFRHIYRPAPWSVSEAVTGEVAWEPLSLVFTQRPNLVNSHLRCLNFNKDICDVCRGMSPPNVTNCSITCHCCLRDAQIAIF